MLLAKLLKVCILLLLLLFLFLKFFDLLCLRGYKLILLLINLNLLLYGLLSNCKLLLQTFILLFHIHSHWCLLLIDQDLLTQTFNFSFLLCKGILLSGSCLFLHIVLLSRSSWPLLFGRFHFGSFVRRVTDHWHANCAWSLTLKWLLLRLSCSLTLLLALRLLA